VELVYDFQHLKFCTGNLELSKWTIIYSDFQHQYLHLKHLEKSNPDAQILLADISNDLPTIMVWRNNDRYIREWLRNNYHKILHNNIAFVEWDVLITINLPNINVCGFIGKHLQRPGINEWVWFNEIDRLGKYKTHAMGAAPFAIQFMDKEAVNTWMSNEYDDIYAKDIFCELRVPTIMNYAGIKMSEYSLPFVEWHTIKYNKNIPGIYHAIKYAI